MSAKEKKYDRYKTAGTRAKNRARNLEREKASGVAHAKRANERAHAGKPMRGAKRRSRREHLQRREAA